jgi:hypothetical protein
LEDELSRHVRDISPAVDDPTQRLANVGRCYLNDVTNAIIRALRHTDTLPLEQLMRRVSDAIEEENDSIPEDSLGIDKEKLHSIVVRFSRWLKDELWTVIRERFEYDPEEVEQWAEAAAWLKSKPELITGEDGSDSEM